MMQPGEDILLDNDDARLRRAWHPVARSVDVTSTPLAVHLNGDEYTLVRHGDVARAGHGLEDAPFSAIEVIGDVTWGLQEVYGLVWIAQERPVAELPPILEWFDQGYHSGVLTRSTVASAGVLIDNFLDVTHFSYLHRQSFGRSRPVTDDGYAIATTDGRVQLTHDTVLQEGRRNSAGGLGQRRIATYTYWPPYITHLQMVFPEDGAQAAATLICQPESKHSTKAYVLVLLPLSDPDLDDQINFSDRVLSEDLVIIDKMADARLMLSWKSELHTRADRASIEMRRSLSKFLDLCQAAQSAVDQKEVLV
jgi:phenylpropionate dioxygenase-like ring-hydroxylating dioxygenase large terminal subunit